MEFRFRRRAFHLLRTWSGWFGTVVGVITTIYFYHAAQRYPDLVYYVQPVKIAVVSAEEVSDLRVLFHGKEVKEVTTVQIVIWNRGNEPIHWQQVIDGITIETMPSKPILKATVVRVSRPLIDFSCDQTRLSTGKVLVTWKIFEQGDGAVVQLIYAGSPATDIVFKGAIEGQQNITALRYHGKIESAAEQVKGEGRRAINLVLASGIGLLGLVMIIIVAYWRPGLIELLGTKLATIIIYFLGSLVFLFAFLLSIYQYLSIQPAIPLILGP